MTRARSQLLFLAIISLIGSACYGPRLDQFPPAREPAGIVASLTLANDSLLVELLALEEDALLVLVDDGSQHRLAGRLARIPYNRIQTGQFEHAGRVSYGVWHFLTEFGFASVMPETHVAEGGEVARDPELLERLRLLSRYPQGVSEALLTRLEAAYGELATPGPRRNG